MSAARRLVPWVPLLAVGLAVFAVYAWSARYWIDLVDEGYFLDLASRVYSGDLPYRDFETYYTPGIFYLFSGAFHLFGVSIMPIRLVMAVVRALCAVLLIRLSLRVAPWPFAVLPFLLIAALDNWPVETEPHPAWPAIAACLLTMELVAIHQATPRLRWLVLAGTTAALAFWFKQNVGAFTAIALGGYILLRPSLDTGRVLRAAQTTFALALAVIVTLFLTPGLDEFTGAALWLPTLLVLGAIVRWAWEVPLARLPFAGVRRVLLEAALAGAAFAVATLAWLVPLTLALGLDNTPFALFLGSVNQTALISRFSPPSLGVPSLLALATWLLALMAVLPGAPAARARWPILIAAVAAFVILPRLPLMPASEPFATETELAIRVRTLNDYLGSLYLYLPAFAGVAGAATLLLRSRSTASPAPWYLLFGSLAALALYPRADAPHVVAAAPPILVAGAWALAQAQRALSTPNRLRQVAAYAALLIVPLAAVAPQAYWRYSTVLDPSRIGRGDPYVPLALDRAPVLMPRKKAESVRDAVAFVQAGTPPGQPFFVYPLAPLFNFLVDRPNPARFSHFLPGALTMAEQREVIADLEAARPRYVLWDHLQVITWGTDPANRPLSDYIWHCYAIAATFDLFLVLERHDCSPTD